MVSPQVLSHVKSLIASRAVFVASKTYCPYCQRAKRTLFEELHVSPDNVTLLELDTMDGGADVQEALLELSGQRTVPNIYIRGEHVGGNDDLQAAKKSGALQKMLKGL